MNPSLKQLANKKKVLVVCGSGGVGKTTASAALGLQAALLGKKVIVLTIDPARRLATALGLKELSDTPKAINSPLLKQSTGSLDAMMLDTKHTFDWLIRKHAKSPEVANNILENRLYQHLSSMMAGSQEYMAMERLYEIYHQNKYDLIILDTPPTRNALNFLAAPKKMVELTRESVLKWFLKPGLFAGKVGFGVFKKTAEKILSVFDQLAGFSFLHELAEMLSSFADMLGGFGDRAENIYTLLRSSDVSFVLVTTPETTALKDAVYFYEKIHNFELPLAGFILNRVYPEFVKSKAELDTAKKQVAILSKTTQDLLLNNLKNFHRLHEQHQKRIDSLQKECGASLFYQLVPYLETDIHDLDGLNEMGQHLISA